MAIGYYKPAYIIRKQEYLSHKNGGCGMWKKKNKIGILNIKRNGYSRLKNEIIPSNKVVPEINDDFDDIRTAIDKLPKTTTERKEAWIDFLKENPLESKKRKLRKLVEYLPHKSKSQRKKYNVFTIDQIHDKNRVIIHKSQIDKLSIIFDNLTNFSMFFETLRKEKEMNIRCYKINGKQCILRNKYEENNIVFELNNKKITIPKDSIKNTDLDKILSTIQKKKAEFDVMM